MSAIAAYRLGFEVAILEKIQRSPAGQLTHNEFVGWVEDKKLIEEFTDASSVITLENEFIDSAVLKRIEDSGKKVIPSSKTIGLIQDKFIQKKTLQKFGIPVPNFFEVKSIENYEEIIKIIGNPFVLKSRKMGYDGYGNAMISSEKEFKREYERLTKRNPELLAEEFINFEKELAVLVVKNRTEIKTYPVVETIQENHICKVVIAPASVSKKVLEKAAEIGIECVKAVEGCGLFGIEFFLDNSGNILVNEMAPRPHNSGHYTIEACKTSQFENHIRSIMNLPLGSVEMVDKAAVMINLLGKRKGKGIVRNYRESLCDPDLHLHIYGKERSRIGRKMGHITFVGSNRDELLQRAYEMEKKIII